MVRPIGSYRREYTLLTHQSSLNRPRQMTMPEYDGEPLENNCCFPGTYEAASCVPCPAGTFSLVRPKRW